MTRRSRTISEDKTRLAGRLMATILDCPSCSRKLRLPEGLTAQKVQCPSCGHTFDLASSPTGAFSPGEPPAAAEPIQDHSSIQPPIDKVSPEEGKIGDIWESM